MPALDALALVPDSPGAGQGVVRVPSTSDTYNMPRAVAVAAGTLTSDVKAFDISTTWNAGATTFTGLKFNVTDTASASASLLADFQVGGTSQLKISKAGVVTATGALFAASGNIARIGASYPSAISLSDTSGFGWANGIPGTNDTSLVRDGAAGVIAQRNGTNAQTHRVYGTYTDGSNYRRVAVAMTTAGAGTIGPEGAGTGASGNTLQVNTGATTVASLPAAATAGAGARLFVTDANATTFASIVAAGGSNGVPVYSDGTNWRIG